jgi:ribosomal protein S14
MSFEKNLKQIKDKPIKLARYLKFNQSKKRKFGKSIYKCRKCRRTGGVIRKYGILYCRQCFREEAEKLGFRKYN